MSASKIQRLPLIAAVLLAAGLLSRAALADPDCQCRSNGEFFVQGEHTCIKTSNGYRLARCDMVLNNTSWTIIGDSCPLTELDEGQQQTPLKTALAHVGLDELVRQ